MKKLIRFFTKIISLIFIVKSLSIYIPDCYKYFFLLDFRESSYLFYINLYNSIVFLIIGILLWLFANKISISFSKNSILEKDIDINYIKKITLFIVGFSLIYFSIPELIRVIHEKMLLSYKTSIKSVKIIAETVRIIISIVMINKSKNI